MIHIKYRNEISLLYKSFRFLFRIKSAISEFPQGSENEVKCSTFDMEMIFHSHANKTHFHKKDSQYTRPYLEGGVWNSEMAYSLSRTKFHSGIM